ncbi:MAG TPA: amino acid adenylation domain-containing protein [Thermoanaerobaculia bacterium]|nr:amino acid adenylation domain-containing protein [Thermoanaerobaculia bacterium]
MSWGIQPQAMIGHSLGEYVAACLSGVLRLEDALALVALRGKLMQELPTGGMLAVPLGETEIAPLLGGGLSVAAVNGPRRTVVSGPWPAIEDLEKRLAVRGIEGKRLRTSHAFHSAMMDPMLPAFAERLRTVRFGEPTIPYVSGTTGDWVTADQAADTNFWLRQLREPVRFGDGTGRLLEQRDWALLEVGPGRTLSTLVQQHPALRAEHLVVSSLHRSAASENASLLDALGSLWVAGVEVDWTGFYRGERRRRVSLPTYPFERQRYFIDRPAGTGAAPWTELAARQELAGPVENETMRVEVDKEETTTPPDGSGRHEALVHLLKEVVQDLTGMPPERLDPYATFLDIGVDSLLLIQAAQRLRDRFGVQLSVVQFLEDLPTLDSVAGHIEEQLPAARLAEILGEPSPPSPLSQPPSLSPGRGGTTPSPVPEQPVMEAPPLPVAREGGWERGTGGEGLAQLFSQQLQVISQVVTQQLQILQGGAAPTSAPVAPPQPPPPAPAPVTYTQAGPFHPIEKRSHDTLSAQQRDYLDRFIRRYAERTAKSKKLTETYRPVLADGRGTVAFRRLWKEIVYPIHSQKSKGSRIWDADGNEYVDVNMGFGLHFFGHSPDFLMDALERQMRQGIEVGPQPVLAGRVAGLIRELTGMDRSIVCTSGTEAIQGALRVARTVTGRGKVALFSGSYHGWSDFTFVRPPAPGRIGALPGTPGVSAKTLEEVVVLEYGTPEALEQIEALGPELAAVLIEPVRSRTPELQPREFLHDLRRVTRKTGTVLIFDEIITGFRIHPGGAQAWFDVEADLATYGKLIGGGLPIGVLSGRAAFMDTLDGGAWRFGDDSFPQTEKTLFTGTFFKHPLTLAAATAVLERLKRQGPGLQESLNARTAQLAADLNAYLQSVSAPMEVVHFGSLFRFRPAREMQYPELFYFHLVHHGLYFTQESGNCFLTTAHTEEDVEKIQRAVRLSVEDLQQGGFLPAGRPAARPAVAMTPEPAAPPAEAYDLPVPDNQRILWIGSRMGPNASRAYNEPLALRLRGRLHILVLQAAVQGIADRHPALRASFPGDGMRQRIAPHVRVPLPLIDLSALGETRRAAELRWCLKALGGHEFNLEHGPLLRISLVRWDAEDHYLSLAAHHIVIDGGSAGVMVRELCLQYTAWLQGKPSPLGPAGSYADWVLRVVGRAETDPDQQVAEAYWRELFSRPVSLMQLPADRPRPRSLPFWGDRRQHRLDAGLVSGIRRLSTGERATPFATALAALGVLLHHLTGQDDIIVGIPSRDPSVTGPMVGYFINLLPVRMQWQPLEGFDTYLGRVKRALLEVQEHQNYPLNRLLEKLGLAGGLDGFLIGTTFNMERIDTPPTMPGLETEYVWVYPDTARIDLHINVIEEGHTGFGLLEAAYRTSLFDPATMDRWLFAFIQVLGALAEDPRRSLGGLSLLSPEQRQQLVSEWNDTRDGVLSDLRLHDLFETQADRSPAAPAVALDDAELSYGELDRLATRLAGTLAALGVGPEVRVGLCLERSFELIVALLAILKAGGAYVPLEPTHPRERLLSLLGDSEAPLLITRHWVIDKLGSGLDELGVRTLDVDAGWPDEDSRPVLPARQAVEADNLAYVIYTSGSTGKPNGVLVSHRSAVNLVRQMGTLYEAGPGTRIPLVAALTFDVSVFELFLALAFGGCLCLVREEERTNPALLAEKLARHRVTTAFFTPSMLSVLPEAPLAPVPTLGVGGEASTSELVARWSHGHRLLNCYGPTEATVFATVDAFEEEEIGLKAPPIGRPIGNLEAYVVDAWLRPVPPGVVGELAIGGAGVARGYLGRVAKTAEKFVPDPFAARRGEIGARLYRTGDLARVRPDGRIETLGRADGQVKLRGVRIELGEVESTLTAQPGVREAAVDVRGEGTAQRLAAYVVWEEGGQDSDLAGLRRRIAALLPESMVPASWIEVQALPRTANGKLDRLVLRALQDQSGEPERHEEPRTPLERFLVELWLDVLRLERLSIHDNFLELGGNSINGAMLAFHLQEALGENMHAVVIFDAPTVAELARFLAIRYPDKVMEIWGEESLPDSVREAILEFEDSLAGGVDA